MPPDSHSPHTGKIVHTVTSSKVIREYGPDRETLQPESERKPTEFMGTSRFAPHLPCLTTIIEP